MIGRGEHMEVRTYIESTVDHELSGNVIDLCPVGALGLQAVPLQRARLGDDARCRWSRRTTASAPTSSATCCAGRLMRVVPRENEAINETWIADRDRFSYEGVYSADRLRAPAWCASDGEWVDDATGRRRSSAAAKGCKAAARDGLGVLAQPLEHARGAVPARPHRARARDRQHRSSPAAARFPRPGRRSGFPATGPAHRRGRQAAMRCWSSASNLRREAPMLAHRVRKAARAAARRSRC